MKGMAEVTGGEVFGVEKESRRPDIVQAEKDESKVVYEFQCYPCPKCDEPVCPNCHIHYVDCSCPLPYSEMNH